MRCAVALALAAAAVAVNARAAEVPCQYAAICVASSFARPQFAWLAG
jgi:hypothetical protein